MPITITANNPTELAELLGGLGYSRLTGVMASAPALPATPASAPAAEPASQPAGDTKPKGRGKGKGTTNELAATETKPAEDQVTGEVQQPVQPVADMKNPTVEDARAALQKYFAKHGPDKSRELLKEFGAAKVSEIPADKLAAFVEKALT